MPSLNWSAREGRIGSAQSQPEITPGSVAHPAVKAAITLSLRQSLDLIANLSGCAQRADTGLGRAKDKLGLGCLAPLARGDAQGGDQDQTKGGPQRNALAKGRGEPSDNGDHGVRPVRWSSIRAARAFQASTMTARKSTAPSPGMMTGA